MVKVDDRITQTKVGKTLRLEGKAEFGVWAVFVFWIIFSKIFKHRVQGFYGQVRCIKKPMLSYGKNMHRNNQFSVYLLRKKNILPRKKSDQIFEKFTQNNKIYPVTESRIRRR